MTPGTRRSATRPRVIRVLALIVAVVAVYVGVELTGAVSTVWHRVESAPPPKKPEAIREVLGTDTNGLPLTVPVRTNSILAVVTNGCDHCVQQLDELRGFLAVGKEFDRYDLSLILVSLDEAPKQPVDSERAVTVVDKQGDYVMKTFGRTAVPIVVYLGADGRVLYQRSGYRTAELDRMTMRQVFGTPGRGGGS